MSPVLLLPANVHNVPAGLPISDNVTNSTLAVVGTGNSSEHASEHANEHALAGVGDLAISVTLGLQVSPTADAMMENGVGNGNGLGLGLQLKVVLSQQADANVLLNLEISTPHFESLALPIFFISIDRVEFSPRTLHVKLDSAVERFRSGNDVPSMSSTFTQAQPTSNVAVELQKTTRVSSAALLASVSTSSVSSESVFATETAEESNTRTRRPPRQPANEVEQPAIPRPAFEQLTGLAPPTQPLIDPSFFGMSPAAPLDLPRQALSTVLPAPLNLDALLLAKASTRAAVIPQTTIPGTTGSATSEETSPMPEAALALEELAVVPEVAVLPPIAMDRVPEPGAWAWIRDPKVWVASAIAIATALSCWAIERKHRVLNAVSGLRRRT